MRIKYQADLPFHLQYKKRLRRRRRLVVTFVLIVLLAVAAIVYDLLHNSSVTPVTSKTSITTIAGPPTFKTPYFEFEDYGDWRLLAKESTSTKFSFYKYSNSLTEHELIIYINQAPPNLAVSRSLPVQISADGTFSFDDVTDHCQKAYAPGEPHHPKIVKVADTTFPCDPDTSQFSILVAQKGGSNVLTFSHQNKPTKYVIYYRDLTYTPSTRVLFQVMHTFRPL